MGRGRDPRPPQQQPGGGQYGGRPDVPPYPGAAPHAGGQPWPPAPPSDGPEYFGQPGGPPSPPRVDDDPGHTRAFTIGDAPDGYGQGGYGGQGHNFGGTPDDPVSTYRAGQATSPPAGPRLHWKELLSGIFLRPQQTFWQMRDYQVWAPALIVTFVYGLFLAVFGFTEEVREDLLATSLSRSVPLILGGGVAVVISMLMLGAVTNVLARQFDGDGIWAPTVGLSMLITSLTDAPRLLFAILLPLDHGLVQIIAWGTWAAGGALLTIMITKSHDLPWSRALGACSIQIVALLALRVLLPA